MKATRLLSVRTLSILAAIFFCASSLKAQTEITRAELLTRVEYIQENIDGNNIGANSGFKGKFIFFRIDGSLAEGLTYSYRQRINKPTSVQSLFDATDFINLTYTKGPWSVSGGKQIVATGGYEYDRAPFDLYYCSEYWYNLACFQFGVSGTYAFTESDDKLTFQISESPFRRGVLNPDNDDIYAYNLMWTGSHEWFKTTYSINVMEYAPGKYINYLALGNRFEFGDLALELDFINKGTNAQNFLLEDYCLIGDLCWKASDALNLFVKVSYDRNKSVTEDLCVAAGTDVFRAGGGIEYFPLKNNRNVRLHLNCCYTDGKSPAANSLRPEQTILDAGLTWKLDFLSVTRK